jgi:hypothetical protein
VHDGCSRSLMATGAAIEDASNAEDILNTCSSRPGYTYEGATGSLKHILHYTVQIGIMHYYATVPMKSFETDDTGTKEDQTSKTLQRLKFCLSNV